MQFLDSKKVNFFKYLLNKPTKLRISYAYKEENQAPASRKRCHDTVDDTDTKRLKTSNQIVYEKGFFEEQESELEKFVISKF
jgi:hypothetical protein